MNKYIIVSVVMAVVGLGLFYGLNVSSEPENLQVNSMLRVVEANTDFGDIDIFSGKVSTTYTIRNEGTEDVQIISGVTSCMCTEGEIAGLRFGMHGSNSKIVVIPAGGEEILTAIFDPLAHGPQGTGKITRELTLQTNSTVSPVVSVKFTGNVTKG